MRCRNSVATLVAVLFALCVDAKAQAPQQAAPTNRSPTLSLPPLSQAPLGLLWGATVAQIQSAGIRLAKNDFTAMGQMFMATNLPKTIADTQAVGLFFTRGNRLWRIVIILSDTENDPYGSSTRSRYEELQRILELRYGRGSEISHTDRYYGGDDWVMGLHMGKNYLGTRYETPELSALLNVQATDSNTSHCVIYYEHKKWGAVFRAEKSSNERDAL